MPYFKAKLLDCLILRHYHKDMNELIQLRSELDQLKHSVNRLLYFRRRLPPGVFGTDLYTMLEEINYLKGYLDCMISFEVELPPESDD